MLQNQCKDSILKDVVTNIFSDILLTYVYAICINIHFVDICIK